MMRAIRLFDEVEIDTGAIAFGAGTPYSYINIETDTENVPAGPGNLAYIAAELMAEKYPGLFSRIDISIKKSIPVAAGLGGGSADAAAVLLYLAKISGQDIKLADLAEWGAVLGKDVPFCVYACAAANPDLGYKGAGAALAEGAGEIITPVSEPEKAWVVLINPQVEVPTKQVYEMYDNHNTPGFVSDNDLEAPCAEAWPVVAETLKTLKGICPEGVKVQLSGSGPSVFAYFSDTQRAEAERVYTIAKEAFDGVPIRLIETL